jgi:hypothetical protein
MELLKWCLLSFIRFPISNLLITKSFLPLISVDQDLDRAIRISLLCGVQELEHDDANSRVVTAEPLPQCHPESCGRHGNNNECSESTEIHHSITTSCTQGGAIDTDRETTEGHLPQMR